MSLAGSSGSYPTLRYVLVSYNQSVGIGETLIEALGAALGVDPGDSTGEPPPDNGSPEGTPEEQIAQLLAQAQAAFDEAQAALEKGDLAGYQDKNNEAADYIEQALEIADAEGIAPSPEPDPSESASPDAG